MSQENIFKSKQEMPKDGNSEVVRTAMTHVEKRNDPVILGEKGFTSHAVVHTPEVHRGKHY